jgi:hypothetical protein
MSVLVKDFVAENTCRRVSAAVPLKYHSSASFPLRTTARQLDALTFAVFAMASSFVASSPWEAGETLCHWLPGTVSTAAPEPDPVVVVECDDEPDVHAVTHTASSKAVAARALTRRGPARSRRTAWSRGSGP